MLLIELIRSIDWKTPLDHINRHFDRPLYILNKNLSGTKACLPKNAAALAQNHADLYIIADIELVVDADFAVKFRYPCDNFHTSLVGNFFEIFLHNGLFESFFGPFDWRFVANHALIVNPGSFESLLQQILFEFVDSETALA